MLYLVCRSCFCFWRNTSNGHCQHGAGAQGASHTRRDSHQCWLHCWYPPCKCRSYACHFFLEKLRRAEPTKSRVHDLHIFCLGAHEDWIQNYTFVNVQAPEYKENRIHTGWLDSRIAMRVRAERPPWEISVVGGALYVRCFQDLHCLRFSFSNKSNQVVCIDL